MPLQIFVSEVGSRARPVLAHEADEIASLLSRPEVTGIRSRGVPIPSLLARCRMQRHVATLCCGYSPRALVSHGRAMR